MKTTDFSSKRPFYLMYEVEARELRSRIFAASQIINSASRVVVFQHSELFRIALFSKPGEILIKSASYNFLPAIKLMRFRGFNVLQHQEEGIHSTSSSDAPLTMSRQVNMQCSKYLAWHVNDALVSQKSGFSEPKIVICGNMRFEYLKFCRSRRLQNLTNPLRILVLTNFDLSRINYPIAKKASREESAAISKVRVTLTAQKKLATDDSKLYSQFLEDHRLQNYDVVVRRYFFETASLINSGKNLRIDENVDFYDSLEDADIVLHYGSTGGIEGSYLGLPSIILTSNPQSQTEGILHSSIVCTKIDDLFDQLHQFDIHRSQLTTVANEQSKSFMSFNGFNLDNSFEIQELISSGFAYPETNPGNIQLSVWIASLVFYTKSKLRDFSVLFRKEKRVKKASLLRSENVRRHLNSIEKNVGLEYRISSSKKIVTFYQ